MKEAIEFWVRIGDVFKNRVAEGRTAFESYDLSGVSVCSNHVDTFKQLISGFCNISFLERVAHHLDNYKGAPILIDDHYYKLSRSSSHSGFQYIFKNLDVGVVILFKSFYSESDANGTHLKIEYSPHFLSSNNPDDVDRFSAHIASKFMAEFVFSSVAVHLACDFTGWDIPDNLEKNLRTKAKRSYDFKGIDDFSFDIHTELVRYGSNDSYTLGSAGGLQMCLYNKTKEINRFDKVSYWCDHWLDQGLAFLDNFKGGELPKITRLEARFHHSVIKQFNAGTNGLECNSFCTLAPHLNGLWRYFLNTFRLHHSKKYISPVWQKLIEDCDFGGSIGRLVYRRSYKGESGSSRRNVAFWVGNALRLFSRQGYLTDFVVKYFLDSGLVSELKDYCKLPPMATIGEVALVFRDYVDKKMLEHRLNGAGV